MSKRKKSTSPKPEMVEEEVVETAVEVPHSKSEERRRSVMAKSEKITVEATVNARLPDGTFVAKGETVEVSQAYVDRLQSEKDKTFIIK